MTTDDGEVIEEITFDGQGGSSQGKSTDDKYIQVKPRNPPKEWLKKNVRMLGEKGTAAAMSAARKAVELKERYDAYESERQERAMARLARQSQEAQYRAELAEAGRRMGIETGRANVNRPMMAARRSTFIGQREHTDYFSAARNQGGFMSSNEKSPSLLFFGASKGNMLFGSSFSSFFGSGKKSNSLLPGLSLGGSNQRRRKTRGR